jgi:hypothetical protein
MYPSLLSQYTWTAGASSNKELGQQPAHQAGLPLGLGFNKLSYQNVKKIPVNISQAEA